MSNEILPAGTYRARATEAQLGETSAGKEQVAIGFSLIGDGVDGHFIPYYGQFGEKSLPHTLKALRACGWTGLDLSDLNGITANEVNLVVEHEEYPTGSGAFTAKVKWVNPLSMGLVKKALDPAASKSFAQRMRGAIAALDAAQPKVPAPRQPAPAAARSSGRPPEPPPLDDSHAPNPDDMPF